MTKPNKKGDSLWQDIPLVGESEVFAELAAKKGSTLFLGRYSMNEVLSVLSRRNFLKEARRRFLWPLEFGIDSSEYPVQRFLICLRERKEDNIIVDLKLREMDFSPRDLSDSIPGIPPQRALSFEWLTLQNPLLEFSEKRRRLPGQAHPGLSMSKKIKDLFVYLGRVTGKDCLVAFPAYFHNALLFSRFFHFWNPVREGEVAAIRRAFRRMPLHKLAWIVHLNCLRRENGTVYEWTAAEQLLPLTQSLKRYFESRGYREVVKGLATTLNFTVDWREFERKSRD